MVLIKKCTVIKIKTKRWVRFKNKNYGLNMFLLTFNCSQIINNNLTPKLNNSILLHNWQGHFVARY